MSDADLHEQFRKAVENLERISELPTEVATVIEVNGHHVLASSGRGAFALKRPAAEMEVGDSILVNAESKQYIEHSPFAEHGRLITHVTDVREDQAIIIIDGKSRLVPVCTTVKPGDRVLLDQHASIVLDVMKVDEEKQTHQEVLWDDIGGNHEAKRLLREAIEDPYKHPKLYEAYGAKPANGALLLGPPGCGKTMLAKAAATAIGSAAGFFSCSGAEVLDPYVGVAEATIRGLYARARRYHEETGRRAIVFVDEADAILSDRDARHAHMEKTIVPTFLTEMDGINESVATTILSTNRSFKLDSALVRDGRIDLKIFISRPGADDSKEILLTHLRRSPCQEDVSVLADKTVIALWSMSFENSGERHAVEDFVSGALLAGLVEHARKSAMRRDIEESAKQASGINLRDMAVGAATVVKGLQTVALDTHYED